MTTGRPTPQRCLRYRTSAARWRAHSARIPRASRRHPHASLDAAERAADAAERTPDVITTFPGGVASSGSKAGSSYDFLIAATYAEFCPTLKSKLGENSKVPDGVGSIMEIILNGKDLDALKDATRNAIYAAADVSGLIRISAGNYGGRLGKTFIHLHELLDGVGETS